MNGPGSTGNGATPEITALSISSSTGAQEAMKAAVLIQQNAPLEIYEVELPMLDVGQVLVKIEHSGICGKQIDEITGRQGEDRFLPHLLGHEGGGEVVEIGPGVKKVRPGDRVVMHWVKGSGIDSPPPRFNHNGRVL